MSHSSLRVVMPQEHDTMRGVAGHGELPTQPSRWRRIVWGEGVPRFNAIDDEGTPLFIPDDRWIAPWSAGAVAMALHGHDQRVDRTPHGTLCPATQCRDDERLLTFVMAMPSHGHATPNPLFSSTRPAS